MEIKKKIKYKNAHTDAQTQHPTAPVIDTNDRMVAIGKESREFDNIGYIFNGNMNTIGCAYDMLSGMFIFIFIFIFFF